MPLRIAFIGSGFAVMHIEALNQIDEVQVVAICSRNEVSARKIINNRPITYYPFDDYLKMLRTEKLDAVYICLPPHLHGDIDIACAEHVKGIFIEKPIALSMELSYKLQDYFKKAESIVSVGYMNRYRTNLINARKYFTVNKPVLINAAWSDTLPPPYWWRQRKMSGGQLTEQCTHITDSIRYIAGEFEEVNAYSTSGFIDNIPDFNVDDAMIMNFRLKSGTIGTIQTSCFTHDHGGGALGIYLDIGCRNKTYRFSDHQLNLSIQGDNKQVETFDSREDALLIENIAFVTALKTQNSKGILSPYKDAIESLKISLAADISIAEKRNVKINEL